MTEIAFSELGGSSVEAMKKTAGRSVSVFCFAVYLKYLWFVGSFSRYQKRTEGSDSSMNVVTY